MSVDWILGQALFWILVAAIVLTGVIGIRRAGAVLVVQQAGLVGARSALGSEQGRAQAGADLNVWWGVEPDEGGQAVYIERDPARRSIVVRVRGAMRALLGGSARLGADSFQRVERFYPGPPGEFE